MPAAYWDHAMAIRRSVPGWEEGDRPNLMKKRICPMLCSVNRWRKEAPASEDGPTRIAPLVFWLRPHFATMRRYALRWILSSCLKVKKQFGRGKPTLGR